MELKAGTEGPELALGLCDHRFRKSSGLVHRNDATLPRHVADYGE
jgi:hypothetical protein